ncbi:hypothetical protein diail_2455 [Diaporthe ilicicola]|nr:hypothetical protein diail_2455 [Diaporthe ilicicola]
MAPSSFNATNEDGMAADGRAPGAGSPDQHNKDERNNDDASERSKIVTANYGQGGPRFWAVMTSLALTSFLASLENSVVVTSGPAVVADLEMGEEYVWVANAFFVCCAAVQPLLGQLCNIFGRRWVMISVTALFTLGSGICGGATSGGMLIAGRGVQGAGSGGVVMIAHIILADLVPLRQRGYYIAILMAVYGVGLTIGPLLGGAIVDSISWRWVFYINLPIGGLAVVILYLLLRLDHNNKGATLGDKMRRVDWVGNALLMTGTIIMLYALTYAGGKHPWAAWQTLVPLLLGVAVVLVFGAWEVLGSPAEPVMPPRLFRHRTSAVVAANTFLYWMLVYWGMYFLPLVFQAVFLFSAERAGVALLPMSLVSIPGTAAAAAALSRWGRFKLLHLAGQAVFTLGLGLFALQREGTSTAQWAAFQCVWALGAGLVMDTLLPAFQAPVPESDQAAATATWAFIRTVGGVWGVAVPASIFNNRVDRLAHTIPDAAARRLLSGGGAYQHAYASFVESFPEPVRGQVRAVYREALKYVFLASVVFGGVAFLLFFLEKEVPLRKSLETEYGLERDPSSKVSEATKVDVEKNSTDRPQGAFEDLQATQDEDECQTQLRAPARLEPAEHENGEEGHGEVDDRVDRLGAGQEGAHVDAPAIRHEDVPVLLHWPALERVDDDDGDGIANLDEAQDPDPDGVGPLDAEDAVIEEEDAGLCRQLVHGEDEPHGPHHLKSAIMSASEPIVIIGSGCRFPGDATTPSKLWDALREPQDHLTPISEERFSTRGFYHEAGDHHGHTNVTQAYLVSEYRRFDAHFFGVSPAEAKVMDPQMRLLLETVYEALESGGQTIHDLQGTDTAVYAGVMTGDYEQRMARDLDSAGTYHVTGTARSLLANRVSYFFDWRGPSVTLDTACSSGLFAVHHAVQQLRSGHSRVAVAAGANLLLDPAGFVGESKLRMLSPGGRSRMWDAGADGYARGEGVAAVVLKTLAAALADGDDIECVIRETAVNQDGRTRGITIASVNSFGFGGANAHAILEEHSPCEEEQQLLSACQEEEPTFLPFIFSAASRSSLLDYLASFARYLRDDGGRVRMRDLAHTLNSRRTRFPFAAIFSASTTQQLAAMIESRLASASAGQDEAGGEEGHDHWVTRAPPPSATHHGDLEPPPRVLAVFTGQGAQWGRMGAELVSASAAARQSLAAMEARLALLPARDRPAWSLTAQLQEHAATSMIGTAAVSQPLCTAVQVVLVDLLRAAGVHLSAAVGHSSGEIAAAYACGLVSAGDAVCIAYYRGLCAASARGPAGQPGAMMAVETTPEDALDLLQEPEFCHRACIAAVNAASSVTLSGDTDAIDEMAVVFKDEGKFARRLKVDKAYHSHHMNPCSAEYLSSMEQLDIHVSETSSPRCTWFSSVYEDDSLADDLAQSLRGQYWDDNMRSPVLFKQAMERASEAGGPFDLVVEIGPHPALKRPVLQTTGPVPYTGLLKRGANDLESLANGLGYIAAHLGRQSVDHQAYERFVYGTTTDAKLVKGLPPYSWNHEHEYWHESRYTRAVLKRPHAVHELLGHLTPDSTAHDMRWRNLLRPQEVPWLRGHQLQNQIIFPAAGYILTALEACREVLKEFTASCIEISNVDISRALVFDSAESSVETVFSLRDIQHQDNNAEITAKFSYCASTGSERSDSLDQFASGSIHISLGDSSRDALPAMSPRPPNLIRIKEDEVYSSLARLGYQYSDAFRALSGLERKLGRCTGLISDVRDSQLLVHPGVLDTAFQAVILSCAYPDDGTLWSMHVPVRVRRIRVNPGLCAAEMSRGGRLPFQAFRPDEKLTSVSGDVDIFPAESPRHAMLQVEGLECIPLSPPTARDDRLLFSSTTWGPALPDARSFSPDVVETRRQYDLASQLDRIAFFYLRNLEQNVPQDHPSRSGGPYQSFFKFAAHTLARFRRSGERLPWKSEWYNDTGETIAEACRPYSDTVDIRLLCELGPKLPDIVTGRTPAIDIAVKDGMLTEYYQKGLGLEEYAAFLAQTIKQITFRSPQPRCLEIGAGTGAATRAIFREAGDAIFSSYTFTDISPGFFPAMQSDPSSQANHMLFKVLDIAKDVSAQGFEKNSYDLVVASMVLHATPSLATTLSNIRSLLRPGGYLVVQEVQPVGRVPASVGTVFGAFPGWWEGAGEGRVLSPAVSRDDWDGLLRGAGFSGIDTSTPDRDPFVQPVTLFVSQAVDDRVRFLREPLSRPAPSLGLADAAIIPDLVLLGGSKTETSALVKQLQHTLRRHCGVIRTARTLVDLQSVGIISSSTTVLGLTELDEPVFRDLTEPKWNTFKAVFHEAGCILWATQGRRTGNAHANMTVGLLRAALNELPGLAVQFLDFESPGLPDASTLANSLLRFKATTMLKGGGRADVYSHIKPERELVIEEDGRVVVPRLIADVPMNDRYNSSRRPIFKSSSVREGHLSIQTTEGGDYFIRQEVDKTASLKDIKSQGQITHSLLTPTKLAGCCRLFLALGEFPGSGGRFLSLSTSNSSVTSSETLLTHPVDVPPGSEARFLQLASLLSLCSELFRGLDEGDRLLVHEPSQDLVAVMEPAARARGISTIFTTSSDDNDLQGCYRVHPNAPARNFKPLGLENVSLFVDLAGNNVAERIRSQLSTSCKCETSETLFGKSTSAPSTAGRLEKVRSCLRNNATELSRGLEIFSGPVPRLVGLGDVVQDDFEPSQPVVVDWTSDDKVPIKVQPVDTQPILSGSKTYWLAGLTGSLGISLCQWMVRMGARHVVLSSRHPDVGEAWLEEMASLGAVVKVYASDITKRDDVVALHQEICSTLPPIAGVVQGAMVLRDTHLSDMSLDTLLQNTRPKVEGSIYLSEQFSEDVLDFFVFLSSASVASGTPGQSAYVAANMFMVGLAEQRRRLGLAASVVNIGPIAGVGFLAHQQQETFAAMKAAMGFTYLSERDFHQMFAEAVLAGRPGSARPAEITSGIRHVSSNEESPPIWASNPIMSHFLLREEASPANDVGGSRPRPLLKTQLLTAKHRDEAGRVIREAFLEKLGTWLQFDASTLDQSGLDDTRLDEIGIDSLIGIEISSWLMKNLQFNLPVLKILSGISIGQIVKAAVEGISASMIPQVQQDNPIEPIDQEARGSESDSTQGPGSSYSNSAVASGSDGDAQSSIVLPEPNLDTNVPQAESWESTTVASMGLSSVQSMFWVNLALFEDKASQNFAGLARISGPVNVSHLEEAVQALGQRHESLRTFFFMRDGKMMQRIMENSALRLDAREISDEREVAREARSIEEHDFDLERGETLRLVLLSLSPTRHFLILGTNHLAMDGFSFQVILRELLPRNDTTELKTQEPPLQFREHFQEQERDLTSGKLQSVLGFWKAQYHPDLPPPLPILRVSRASSRPTLATLSHDKVEVRIGAEAKAKITAVCREARATPFHFYLACYRALLARYAPDAEDVAIGIEDAGRRDVRSLGAVGVFLNVLPLRFRTKVSAAFANVLRETTNMMHAALENAQVPFPVLLNELDPPRSATYTPILQTTVNYRSGQRLQDRWGDCELEFEALKVSATGYDLNLDIIDDPSGGCLVSLIFRSDLYRVSEATMLANSYEKLLHAFSTKPDATLTEPSLFERRDVQRALTYGLGPLRTSRWPETVIHKFQDLAEAQPNSIAIRGDSPDEITSYGELSKLSASIAMAVAGAGASKGSRIAVLQEPTPLWVASILAIMRIGAVYLPLDLSLPRSRLAAIARDSQTDLVLVDKNTAEHADELQASGGILQVDMSSAAMELEAPPPIAATADGPALIFYTSGSSGVPKGVVQTHEGIRNHMELTEETYSVGSAEVVLQQSACSFDLSCAQIFTALCFGGSIYILPRHLRSDSRSVADLIVQHGITYTYATPSEYSGWLRHGEAGSLQGSSWRRALCGGEPVTDDLLGQFRGVQKTDLRLFNCYGPTETTIVAATAELNYQDPGHPSLCGGISAGFALPNYTIYVVDENLNLVAPGVQGEIYIGGAGVCPGYLHNPGLTAESFVRDPFATSEHRARGWTMMHRVGDVGRWKEDGSILVEGRASGDTQVKIRGLRADLRDIESNLVAAAGGVLSQAAVSVRRSSPESPTEFLVAHVVIDPTKAREGIHEKLLRSLPGLLPLPRYMCPAMVVPIEQLPRTSTSKLDRRALAALPLPDAVVGPEDGDDKHVDLTETEAKLRDIWLDLVPRQITAMHEITPDTDFFHVGGTSLLLPHLQAQILARLGVRPLVIKLLQFSTLGGMASLIEERPQPLLSGLGERVVDWEAETALPSDVLRSLNETQEDAASPPPPPPPPGNSPSVVVLTGSTGYLGRGILDALIADDTVEAVHCIGVRNASTRHEMLDLPKTHLHEGDLRLPRLGLGAADAEAIFARATHVIHNGAEVSHLQSYASLRPANVQATREIAGMCLPRRVPLHYVSSTQVGMYHAAGTGRREFPEVSVAAHPPPADGSAAGYPATKWAGERFLERLAGAAAGSWPVFVHRPSTILRPGGGGEEDPGLDLLENLRRWSARLGAVPVAPNLHGYVDTVELRGVVEGVVGSALRREPDDRCRSAPQDDGRAGVVQFRHYFGALDISLDEPQTLMLGVERPAGSGPLEELMALEWAARARKEGLDPWLEEWIEDVLRRGEQFVPKVVR